MTTAYEATEQNGVVTISASNGKRVISNDPADLLHFLRYSSSGLKVAWDLDNLLSALLHKLPTDVLTKLMKFDSALEFAGHELYYYPGRLWRVGKSRYYSLNTFFESSMAQDNPSLAVVQERADALIPILEQLGLGRKNGGIRKLTSPIACFEDSDWGTEYCPTVPKNFDLPSEALEMAVFASKADKREWVSNHQVGHFEHVTDLDISSAYPSVAMLLPDLRDMKIWKSNTLGDREMSASLGMVQGSFYIDPSADYAHASPIMVTGDGINLPSLPLGKLPEDYYTLDEVRFILNNDLGTFKLKSGWFASTSSGVSVRYPLRDIMVKLYNMRTIYPEAREIAKLIANSLIGKLIESRIDTPTMPARWRNDVYHATILARTRVNISRFIVANEIQADELLAIQTDGLKILRDIPLKPNGMGSWVNKGTSKCVVISPYKVYSEATLSRPSQMDYNDITRMVSKHPNKTSYGMTNPHRIKFKEAITNYDDISRVGELVDVPTSFDLVGLVAEQNRDYKKLPSTGRELLNGRYRSSAIIL